MTFEGQEGGILCFWMDLEMAIRSTIYIQKQPQSFFNFLRPSTGWTLLGWDLAAEKMKQDYKSCLQNSLQRSARATSLIKRTLFTVVSVLMHCCNRSYCHHKCNTVFLNDSRTRQIRTLEKHFCEIQTSEFVTQSQGKLRAKWLSLIFAVFL